MFIEIDTRHISKNPLYKSLKAKSFTDKDITLHFIIFDILYSPSVAFSESFFEISSKLNSQEYQLLNKNGTTPIKISQQWHLQPCKKGG